MKLHLFPSSSMFSAEVKPQISQTTDTTDTLFCSPQEQPGRRWINTENTEQFDVRCGCCLSLRSARREQEAFPRSLVQREVSSFC